MTALAPFRELPARLVEIDVDGLHRLATAEPWLVTEWHGYDEIEKFIARNRASLDSFPTPEQLDALLSLAKSRATKCSRPHVTREIAKLVGSFPHAQIPDTKTYVQAMIDDVLDAGIPDDIVIAACIEARRTERYPPPISVFLTICERHAARFGSVIALVTKLREVRLKFERAIEAQHKRLSDLRAGLIEGPAEQLPSCRPLGAPPRYDCVVPTVRARFRDDAEVREALSRMPPRDQWSASDKLERLGPGAAREYIVNWRQSA